MSKDRDEVEKMFVFARDLLSYGFSTEQAIETISRQSPLPLETIESLVMEAQAGHLAWEAMKDTPEGKAIAVSVGKGMMIRGLLWMAFGVAATVAAFWVAISFDFYFTLIFIGALFWGVLQFVRGFWGWIKAMKSVR